MDLDLSILHSQTLEELKLNEKISLPNEIFENSGIISMNDISLTGKIYIGQDELDYIDCNINGIMILEDSISLEPIEYPFSIEYNDILEENCKKDENTLDIFSFLWENIVLEIPLQFTKVTDLSKFHGDGWKLISEDTKVNGNNPFSDLLKDFKEE